MGWRFRKSIKIAPGVRMNIGKKSIGISAGVKGARVSVNSKGRVTKSVGIPGTGLSYVETSNLKQSDKKNSKKSVDSSASEKVSFSAKPEEPKKAKDPSGKPPHKKWIPIVILLLVLAFIFAPAAVGGAIAIVLGFGFIPSAIYLLFFRKKLSGNPKQKKLNIASGVLLILSLLCWVFILTAEGPVPVETLEISAQQLEMDVESTQDLDLAYTPEDADIDDIDFIVSDSDSLTVDPTETGFQLSTLEKEGSVTVKAICGEIESNPITITIVDQERIAAEKKAEEERIAAEKKAEEERIAAEKKAEEERIAAEKQAEAARIAAQNQAAAENSRTVYVTATGKRYHYSSSCNGGTYYASTLNKATSMGLTPCKKCVY